MRDFSTNKTKIERISEKRNKDQAKKGWMDMVEVEWKTSSSFVGKIEAKSRAFKQPILNQAKTKQNKRIGQNLRKCETAKKAKRKVAQKTEK